jgi:type IV pilus assembly protein PilM
MNSCAIDISDRSIKYGELMATSNGLRLGKYGKEKIPEGVMSSGKIEKEEELVRILKKIKDKENLHHIRVSLPEEQMYLFTLSLPKSDEGNIRDMILLQIEEHIPLKAPDTIFEYDIVSTNDKNILVEVVAIAAATMDSYLSAFDKAGLIPISFEIEAQAIARAVIPSGDNSPIMIVDFGDAKTVVSISNNGHVFLTTTLDFGGADLTNMIAKNFSLSFIEAEKMKHEYGVEEASKAQDIFPAILNGISVLRDELNKQYIYWGTHNENSGKNNQINRIILCGGDANLAGLSDYLELSMKIKVENANVWTNILKTQDAIPEMSFEQSLGYATVLGLVLGNYMYETQPVVNILPQEEKRILRRNYWARYFSVFSGWVALVGVVSIFLLIPSYFMSESQEKLVESKLEAFNIENPNPINSNIEKIISDINAKLDLIVKAEPPYKVSEKVLNNILESRTAGITYSQILFNKKMTKASKTSPSKEIAVLEIRGVATNRDTLRNFKTSLDSNPNFAEVVLPVSSFLGKENLDFTISITMK